MTIFIGQSMAMNISEKTKLDIRKVLIITFCWILIVVIVQYYDYASFYFIAPEVIHDTNLFINTLLNIFSALLAGLIGGGSIVFYILKKSRNKPFSYGILTSAISFLMIYIIIVLVVGSLFVSTSQKIPFYSWECFKQVLANSVTFMQMRNLFIWTLIVAVTQFVLQLSEKFGPGILWDMTRGKYFQPREEKRIIMFLDLNDATAIAENLGHIKYHSLLNDFFTDITDPILNRKGSIYQYVGDQVVIYWEKDKGIKKANCLHCFFDIKNLIEKHRIRYMQSYGIVPQFKAGLHIGTVAVGEVGSIKRDIVFSGDVLNTASRIEETCRKFDARILASGALLDQINDLYDFDLQSIGSITLKGKQQKINLFAVERNNTRQIGDKLKNAKSINVEK